MKRLSLFLGVFLFGVFISLCVWVLPKSYSYPVSSLLEEEAGADFVIYAKEKLKNNFYDPGKLDERKLFNAALRGIDNLLESKDLDFVPAKITDNADLSAVQAQFKKEFERAQKLVKDENIALEKSQLAFTAVSALLEAVGDSHTRFITPRELAEERKLESGRASFAGIGAVIGKLEDGYFYLKEVFADNPAYTAGLRRFDRLALVDGQVIGNDLGQLINRIRGPPGSVVAITVERGERKLEFKVTRGDIVVPVLESRIEELGGRKISVLTLRGFDNRLAHNMNVFMEAITAEDRKGVVIDLRGNPGGLLSLLNYLTNLFVEENQHIYTLKSKDREIQYRTNRMKISDLPMVVLIDEGSASASEIFSAVMQEQGRATIIGEKSAGAVSVGMRFPLAHGAGLMITIQRFFTAKGKSLEKNGVIPDERLGFTKEDIKRGKDVQMEKALEVLKKKIESRP